MESASLVVCQHRDDLNDKPTECGIGENPINGRIARGSVNVDAMNDAWNVYSKTNGQENNTQDISENCLPHAEWLLGNIKNDDLASHLTQCLAKPAVHPNRINQEHAGTDNVDRNSQQHRF